MVLTLSQFEGAAAGPQYVVPELCIVSHVREEAGARVLVLNCIFAAVAVIIVDKSGHANFQGFAGDGVVGSAVSKAVKGVEEDAAIEVPDGRAGFASLAGAEDGAVIAVLVVVVPGGDSHLSFYTVYCLLEHVSLNGGDVAVKAKGAANDNCEVDYYPVVACGGVIGEFEVAQPKEATVLVLKYFNSNWIEGGPCCLSAKVAVV
jgi:hypothetical protein